MVPPDKRAFIAFKGLLFLVGITFAVAAVVLLTVLTSAATVTGVAPASAISLVEGLNTGVLGPGEQRWFKLRPHQEDPATELQKSFTLIFTPFEVNRLQSVSLQLFDESQLMFFDDVEAGHIANFGAGQAVTRDNNPQTGELFWTGWLLGEKNYYIQLMNGSNATLNYWLFDSDVYGPALGPTPVPTSTPVFAGGTAPQTAITLAPDKNWGGLEPGQEAWYSFSMADLNPAGFEEMALTMVTTPDDGNRIRYMTFDVFTADGVRRWAPGDNSHINNIGAGSVVYRDNNPLTGERVWSGWLVENQPYYVQIRNGADVHMDYWLFKGDIYNPELDK
jgi:hypothetical protein